MINQIRSKALLTGTFDLPTLEIAGYFCEGQKETGPTYDCAGEPGVPDSVEDIVAYLIVTDRQGNKKRISVGVEIIDHFYSKMEDELLEGIEDCSGGDPDREHDRC